MQKSITREEWLNKGVELLKPLFKENGYTVPNVKVSVGFTGGSKNSIGTCWNAKVTGDNIAQIFIHPKIDDSSRVLDILAHELIHAIFPQDGHRGNFPKCAKAIGLTGKMTATIASPELKEFLATIIAEIGDIPHAKLNYNTSAKKKQTTRMVKLECSCGYIVRTSRSNIENRGLPLCSCGGNFEIA